MHAVTSYMSDGQLSPISDGIDIPGAATDADTYPLTASSSLSSAPTLDNSTSLSSPTLETSTSPSSNLEPKEPYISGNADSHGLRFEESNAHSHAHDHDHYDDAIRNHVDTGDEMQWDVEIGDEIGDDLAIPKIEPMDDDNFCLSDLEEAPVNHEPIENTVPNSSTKVKRPRGRPRKLSIVPAVPAANGKVAKGRSKTGCITCRKRKKKCDEAKPRCMNCEKNAVVCEGYQEKQLWKSGKERAEEELMKNQSLPIITMQPIFTGLETAEDRVFWKHYNDHLSAVFTVEGEHNNAFRDMLVPVATGHQGMMHSLLSLASKHLDYETPYGQKVLHRNAKVSVDSLHHRGSFHNSEAVKMLRESMYGDNSDDLNSSNLLAAQYGQMLCLVLEALAEGDNSSTQRVHYEAFLYLIRNKPPQDSAFRAFIAEIFYYHILADDMVHYPDSATKRLATENWTPIAPIHRARLIGVADGMFTYLCQITTIRNHVRQRIQNGFESWVDYGSLYWASEIESQINEWAPEWPAGDSRMPPDSAAASCASSPSPKLEAMVSHENHFNNTRRHSIANPVNAGDARPFRNTTAEGFSQTESNPNGSNKRRSSPAPVRRPSNHEAGVSVVVEESLNLIEGFLPSDPAQTLLLLPCVVIGTACYAEDNREQIRNAIRVVHGYTGLRNTITALEVLTEVWRLHDAGDYLGAWDWQAVAHSLGVNHIF
ncbi:hypothetical protein SCUCBS95973_006602 [Sporothrix curviconia]|uniref:Zn(2)-C6 fungal-type domain-containing protein n=1 Tax=Sporothrix curviconia TaxID=1260050 RepID=A0ABP0C901_9PEZI